MLEEVLGSVGESTESKVLILIKVWLSLRQFENHFVVTSGRSQRWTHSTGRLMTKFVKNRRERTKFCKIMRKWRAYCERRSFGLLMAPVNTNHHDLCAPHFRRTDAVARFAKAVRISREHFSNGLWRASLVGSSLVGSSVGSSVKLVQTSRKLLQ